MKPLKVVIKDLPRSPSPARAPVSILDPKFVYVPAAKTDVTQTWRKYGWKPIERKEQ
jgi:hypothetical protein